MAKRLVKVSAEWCGPCKVLGTRLKKLELGDQLTNIDVESPEYESFPHNVKNLPTVFVMEGDEILERIVGVQNAKVYLDALK